MWKQEADATKTDLLPVRAFRFVCLLTGEELPISPLALARRGWHLAFGAEPSEGLVVVGRIFVSNQTPTFCHFGERSKMREPPRPSLPVSVLTSRVGIAASYGAELVTGMSDWRNFRRSKTG